MTTAEIKTITANINEARTLANIARRAETLFEDGYTARAAKGFWFVDGPDGQSYIVFTGSPVTGESCTCPAFAKLNECKHHLALAAQIEKAEADDAQADAYDAMMLAAEMATGCDAYARF